MLYELRTYYMNPGKLPNINARFANHTLALFKKHDIHVCDFWQDATGKEMIYYVCAFEDMQTRDAAWERFRDDPEWQRVYAESHADGAIVERIESSFMERVPYVTPDWE